MDRDAFIAELREKLPPFIRERIAGWQKKYAEKRAEFSERLMPYNKRRDEIQAAYAVYLNEGIPRDVKKKKQHEVRPLLRDAIGIMIGVLLAFKWLFPRFNLEITPFIILPMIVLVVFFCGKSVVQFLKTIRYAESRDFADDLASKWRDNNEVDKVESNIEAEKSKWNNYCESLKRCIHSAERALVGSDEELLNYYKSDKKVINFYIENIYDGEW
jgi:hypothetical protein